jgi:hypothetical protein
MSPAIQAERSALQNKTNLFTLFSFILGRSCFPRFGTGFTIPSGSGSYFGKVLVPVPAPVPVPDPDYLAQFFSNKKFVQNLAFRLYTARSTIVS